MLTSLERLTEMSRRKDKHTRHFSIGVVNVTLHTPLRFLMNEYSSLYETCRVDCAGASSIRVDVRPKPFVPWHRRRCTVSVNDQLQFEPTRAEEYLPYVEWAVNWEIPKAMPQFLQLHASSMEIDGVGVIFPGESGSGKSTLTAGLLTRGWRYLCDEFALIHADTLELHPFPRAICVKKASFSVIESLGLSLYGKRRYLKGSKGWIRFVNPLDVRPDAVGRVCPIRYVVFPKYTPGANPALAEISRADAVIELHKVCFNLFGCERLGLDVLANMIRGARCYRLIAGEIAQTCDTVQRLVEGSAAQCARSA